MATTLIVEDGTGLTNSNSFATVAEITEYFDGHLYATVWTAATADQKTQAAIMATRTFEAFVTWEGQPSSFDQALAWPRGGVYDKDDLLIDHDIVPEALKWATAELAQSLLSANRLAEKEGTGIKKLKADVIEIEFDKEDPAAVVPDFAFQFISSFGSLQSRGGMGSVKLQRS